jgi:hypothetical protein
MAEQLGLLGKAVENRNARLEAAHGFAVEHIIKLADAMDAAGFTQVTKMLDNALRSMIVKRASAYVDFTEALKIVQPGDCQAVHGTYKKFVNFLEAEGTFIRARQDCLTKCPSFKPAV